MSATDIKNSSYESTHNPNNYKTQYSNKTICDTEQITFVNCTHNYCVCFIDIVDSTKHTCEITESAKIRQYYSVFINAMSSIIKKYNGRPVKNMGDGLLYYFPRTFDSTNQRAFKDVINCGLEMIYENKRLNEYYNRNGLPSISYRISANYGRVELAVSLNSNSADLFGSTINLCSKINQQARSNQMVIHKDFYEILKKMTFYDQYNFERLDGIQDIDDNNNNNYLAYSIDYGYKYDYGQDYYKNSNKTIERQNLSSYVHNQNEGESTYNILLVDDDKDILFTFKTIFQNEGYKVDSFSNPVEALNHFSQINPRFYNLIIMDIRMPQINGIKLYLKIKIINPDVKVLFLSALNALAEVLSIFPEIKYSEIIRKPVEPYTLLSQVKEIIHSR